MERRPTTRSGARKSSRRLRTFLWIAGLSALIIGLIYFEQTAVLYALATLGLTALLIVVALSDLDGRRATHTDDLGDDAAAIADGITGATATATAASSTPVTGRRPTAKRR